MGRKPKEQREDNSKIIRDRVGERTDLSFCPLCTSHPDCFANIDGRCTALSKADEEAPCAFYKSAEANTAEAKRCYQRLKDTGRSDLISKYIKPLSAMGMLDDEIKAAEQYGEQFETFREDNYREQLEKAMDSGGLDDDLLDDTDYADDADDADADEAFDAAEADDIEENEEEDTDAGDDPWDEGGL